MTSQNSNPALINAGEGGAGVFLPYGLSLTGEVNVKT